LVRPTEIISILIPLLWGIEKISIPTVRKRIIFFRNKYKDVFFAFIAGGLILSVQFIYWKYASGRWFVYSYRDQGFSWLHPHLKVYAFNFQCGWLLYTPMMFLPLIGLIPFSIRGKNKVAIISFILLNYYIVASWDLWDYGGRAMVQSYPILLFPLATFAEWLLKRKTVLLLVAPVILLFTYFNLWWTYQAHKGDLVGSVPATNHYYWKTIFRYNLPEDIQKLRDNRDYFADKVKNPLLLYTKDLKSSEPVFIKGEQHSPELRLQPPPPDLDWIRATSLIEIEHKEWNVWKMTEFVIQFKKGDKIIKENMIRVQRLLNDFEEKYISIDAKIPEAEFDHIVVFFKNFSNNPCKIHSLKIIAFKK
jgi:hypothetical protein